MSRIGAHYGHPVIIAKYIDHYSVECESCYAVIIDDEALDDPIPYTLTDKGVPEARYSAPIVPPSRMSGRRDTIT